MRTRLLAILLLLLAACAGGQHTVTANPTCVDVVEHGYAMQARALHGDFAIAVRREFTRLRPQMVTMCERADLSVERKRCIMAADDTEEAAACRQRLQGPAWPDRAASRSDAQVQFP